MRGVTGRQGVRGDQGPAEIGLHLKAFKIGNSYQKGDYVFVKGAGHDIMYVAEHNFISKRTPKDEPGNWVSFYAPAGPKGDRGDPREGAPGKMGSLHSWRTRRARQPGALSGRHSGARRETRPSRSRGRTGDTGRRKERKDGMPGPRGDDGVGLH